MKNRLKENTIWINFTYYLPMLTSLAFAIFNFLLWLLYGSSWNISIFIYYLLLVFLRCLILVGNKLILKLDLEKQRKRRYPLFLFSSGLLFVLNIALIVPITILALHDKQVTMGMIPAIGMAAYTTYKVITAIIRYKQSRKDDNLLIKEIRTIALIDACVSVLSLQNTLIMVNGGTNESLTYIVIVSSFAITAFIIFASVFSLVSGIRLHRKHLDEEGK